MERGRMAPGIHSRIVLAGIIIVVFMASGAFMAGCAVNPATKQTEFMLVSENEEFRMGQEVDKQVREEMGVYLELPELRSNVKQIAERIGQSSDRPNLIYRAEIIDSPDFNAFALPGGFVYVNRGLLERMNSADELASVMGHEIAHVAARHSAAQISKSQLLNLGLIGATIATGGAIQNYGDFLNLGAALAFTKFSRDDEREADHFGTRYMTQAGFNPEASLDVMKQIQRIETREPSTVETWFMTHPPTSERLENLTQEIETVRTEYPGALDQSLQRNSFIALLDGMAVGEWNGKELVRGDRYYNKEFLLSIPLPEEWQAHINSKEYTAVFAQEKKEYFAIFDVEPLQRKMTSADYFRQLDEYLRRSGLRRVSDASSRSLLPYGAVAGIYTGRDGSGTLIAVEGIAFVKEANGYSFIGMSKRDAFNDFQPRLESMVGGLQFISSADAGALQPARLRVHRVKAGETWDQILQQYFNESAGKAKLAEYNNLDSSTPPPANILLKIPPTMRFR